MIPKSNSSSIFFTLASIAIVIIGLIHFDAILKPFFIAFLIWFVIYRLKFSIGKIKISGKSLPPIVCNILAFSIIFILIYFVVELLIVNLEGITASMPEYISNLNKSYGDVSAFFNDPKYAEYLQEWINGVDLSGIAALLVNSLSGVLATLAVVIIYVIFLLIEDAARKNKFEKLFPETGKRYNKFANNLQRIDKAIRSYIWSKTVISLITGIISYIILFIMGVDYAFLWSFLIFVLNFIPYIGPLISSILPAVFAVLITGDLQRFVWVFAALLGIQILLGNFIEPKVMGRGTNLGPVTVILALAFWGMIWGVTGMILAVPVTSVLVIVCSQIPSARTLAILMSEKGNFPEIENEI